jgi:hypothetical protein
VLNIYVGGSGGIGPFNGCGGGGTFVVGPGNTNPLVVAGGGGGATPNATGGVGRTFHPDSGGGFTGDGGDASGTQQDGAGRGGKGFPLLTGGGGDGFFGDGNGGFGGGGAGANAGGGGGGGDGGIGHNDAGMGGGSFDAGVDQILISGAQNGNGMVIITPVVTGSPEPAPLALIGGSLVGLFYRLRRRRAAESKERSDKLRGAGTRQRPISIWS